MKEQKKTEGLSGLSAEELLSELVKRAASKEEGLDMDGMEEAVEKAASSLKEAMVRQHFRSLPEEESRPKRCPRCGQQARVRSKAVARTIITRAGEVTYKRNYHYCDGCGSGFYPRDEELGIPRSGNLTYEMERRLLDFVVNDTYESAAERFSLHYEIPVSSNLCRRVVARVGTRVEKADDHHLQTCLQEPERHPADLVMVQNDGSMLHTREEGWKEAKLAVLVRGEHHLSSVQTKRGQITQARYLAVLGAQEEFKTRLDKVLRGMQVRKAGQVLWLADGAPGNWRLADELVPGCTEILDWYHAIEHAMDCAKVLLGSDSSLLGMWKQTVEHRLIRGEVDALIGELVECAALTRAKEARTAINNLIRYYRTNENRMAYDIYRSQGFPIGNGTVECAHKHVLQTRMKRGGQHWSIKGARRMVRLRAAYKTAGPRRFHRAIRNAVKLTREQPTLKPVKRRASNR